MDAEPIARLIMRTREGNWRSAAPISSGWISSGVKAKVASTTEAQSPAPAGGGEAAAPAAAARFCGTGVEVDREPSLAVSAATRYADFA